jgi:DNA invertase Pin-like site-specific DNA recombinase
VSSSDQDPETQLCDLRPLAKARGYEIVGEYTDTISGAKAKRPGLPRRWHLIALLVRSPDFGWHL